MREDNFLDDLIAEAELKEEKQTAAFYDLLIMEVIKLEDKIKYYFDEAEKEAQIIKEWALNKNSSLQEKIDFLMLKLENYIREEEKKTIDLPHGILKIRKKPDKVEISDLDLFLANAGESMLTVVPESVKPNLQKIKAVIKMSGRIPFGVTKIEGEEIFNLTLNKMEVQQNDTQKKA